MNNPSDKSFETEPLSVLLDKSVSDMTAEEARAFVKHLRQIRKSPPVLNRQLDNELDPADRQMAAKKPAGVNKKKQKALEDEYL